MLATFVPQTKTGALIIWRSGSSVVLYRGIAYKLPCVQSYTKKGQTNMIMLKDSTGASNEATHNMGVDTYGARKPFIPDSAKYLKDLSEEELMEFSDLNHLLDDLGPRFTDWTGREPLPVDADLLPAVVSGYRPPFRLLPYGLRHCLRNKEMTFIRRLARTMPPHFALGTQYVMYIFMVRLTKSRFLYTLNLCNACRKEQRTARPCKGYGKVMGKKCYRKDSHQTWCTEYTEREDGRRTEGNTSETYFVIT